MNPATTVRSSALVGDGCPLSYRVNCRAEVEILCGGPHGGLKLTFQPEVLREFLTLAAEALDEVDERFIAIRAEAV